MGRPVTLFPGQWADLTLEDLAKKVSDWGFDGLELACWGDHLEVNKVLDDDDYVQSRWDILNKFNLNWYASSTYLVGHYMADDPIDEVTDTSYRSACGAMVNQMGCSRGAGHDTQAKNYTPSQVAFDAAFLSE